MVIAATLTLLIAINALYVAAEFGAVSVRSSRIQQEAEQGNLLARALLPYLRDARRLDRYIAACQIGITISSLVLGAYGQAALAPRLEPLFARFAGLQEVAAQSTAAASVLIGLTILQMILGELVPKSLALQFPTRVALLTVLPLRLSLRLLSWFIVVLNGSGLAILKLLGVEQTGHRHIHSPEEIEYLIAESRKGGLLEPDEHQRLRRALRLTGRQVGEVMVPRVKIEAIPASATPEAFLRQVAGSPYTRLPVHDGSLDSIVGYIHVQDVVRRRLDAPRFNARPTDLARRFTAVHEAMTLERVLGRLRADRQHLAIVLDDYGGTAGLVTVDDLLDEIFGSPADEFKADDPTPETLPDGRIRLPGSLGLGDAERWTGVPWEGDAYTVGGLIMEHCAGLPDRGHRLLIDGVEVEVERVGRRTVDSILIRPVRRREDARG